MRIPPYVLAVLVALAVALPAGAVQRPPENQIPPYDCLIWPEYCGGGGGHPSNCQECKQDCANTFMKAIHDCELTGNNPACIQGAQRKYNQCTTGCIADWPDC